MSRPGEILVAVPGRELERIVSESRSEDALVLIENCSGVIDAGAEVELLELIYERWARAAVDASNVAEAVRIYALGLAEIPHSALLAQNRAYFAGKLE